MCAYVVAIASPQSFDEDDTNEDMYTYVVQPLVHYMFRRGRGTVFAYGQTGSGKTYTMVRRVGALCWRACAGCFLAACVAAMLPLPLYPAQISSLATPLSAVACVPELTSRCPIRLSPSPAPPPDCPTLAQNGIQRLAAEDIFRLLGSRELRNLGLTVHVSFFELYGGRCRDLLFKHNKVEIREDGHGRVVAQGLQEKTVATVDEMLAAVKTGNRCVSGWCWCLCPAPKVRGRACGCACARWLPCTLYPHPLPPPPHQRPSHARHGNEQRVVPVPRGVRHIGAGGVRQASRQDLAGGSGGQRASHRHQEPQPPASHGGCSHQPEPAGTQGMRKVSLAG